MASDTGKPTSPIHREAHPMPQLQIKTAMVQHDLASLNPHEGQGPAYSRLLTCSTYLLYLRGYPTTVRSAIVCPIYKKDDHKDSWNYRPASLTAIVCKLMETALKGDILNHHHHTAALSAAQHGFIPHRSCLQPPCC